MKQTSLDSQAHSATQAHASLQGLVEVQVVSQKSCCHHHSLLIRGSSRGEGHKEVAASSAPGPAEQSATALVNKDRQMSLQTGYMTMAHNLIHDGSNSVSEMYQMSTAVILPT